MVFPLFTGWNGERPGWATSWPTSLSLLLQPCSTCPAFLLLEQPEDLGTVRPRQRPSSMWQRSGFKRLHRHVQARHIAFHQRDFGVDYAKPTRILLRSSMSLPSFMHEQLPSFDADGYYTGPLPRRPDAQPMRSGPGKAFITTGTAAWPSNMCRWVAEAIFHDFLALVNVAGEGDETSRPRQIGSDGTITFNFNSVDIKNAPRILGWRSRLRWHVLLGVRPLLRT